VYIIGNFLWFFNLSVSKLCEHRAVSLQQLGLSFLRNYKKNISQQRTRTVYVFASRYWFDFYLSLTKCCRVCLCSVPDVPAVVYYLREDKLWSQTISTADGQVGGATEVRTNNGTIRAFDVDYNRQLLYWIDSQNKVPLLLCGVAV